MKHSTDSHYPPLDHAAAAEWHVRMRGEESDQQLRRAFEAWLSADLRHRLAYADVSAAAWATEQMPQNVDIQPASLTHRARFSRVPAARYLLASLLGLALVWLLPHWRGWDDMRADWVTARGEVRELALEDGSRLWLDADSAVSQQFAADERRIVLLRGTLFVAVEPNPDRPFVVDADGLTATALGTRYSVSRYGNGSVEVEEGRVAVQRNNQRLEISAGESVDCDPVDCRLGSPTSGDVASWREGLLRFEDAALGEVIDTLRAHLDTRVLVLGTIDPKLKVTALIPSQNAERALRSLCERNGLRVQHWGGWLVVRS